MIIRQKEEGEKMASQTSVMDWAKVREIDEKYYLHIESTREEYQHIPIAKAEGSYYYLADGTKLLDFISGAISVNVGHRHPKVEAAIKEALERYGFVVEFQCTDWRARATQILMESILGHDKWSGRVRFVCSGTEANEVAINIARLFTNRPNIITREGAYHGFSQGAGACSRLNTFSGGLASDTSPEYRSNPTHSAPWGFHVVPAPFCFRCSLGYTYPDCKKGHRLLPCVMVTDRLIRVIGPGTIAGFITEIVQGAGCIMPPPEYIEQIRQLTHDYGILWIDDEVICGFGRVGKWFAYNLYPDTKPDIMTMGKGIVNSALPVSGIVVSEELADFFDHYRWQTASTFAAHPIAMAAAAATMGVLLEENIPQKADQMGQYLGQRLKELEVKHKSIGHVSGIGMLWFLELVKDKKTMEPFIAEDRQIRGTGDRSVYPTMLIAKKCAERGVHILPLLPNTILAAPHLTFTKEEIDHGIEAFDYAFSELDKMCL